MNAQNEIPHKVKLAGDLQTTISDGRNVGHRTIPKGTVCDVVSSKVGQLAGTPVYKLRLYDEIFFANEDEIEKVTR